MLKQTFDAAAGAMYVQVDSIAVETTVEISPRVYVDLAADGRPVGLEVLGLSQEQPLLCNAEIAEALERFDFPEEARLLLGAAVSPSRDEPQTDGQSHLAQLT